MGKKIFYDVNEAAIKAGMSARSFNRLIAELAIAPMMFVVAGGRTLRYTDTQITSVIAHRDAKVKRRGARGAYL